jgi:hypothetical protein
MFQWPLVESFQFAAFQFMALAPMYLVCLSGGDAGTHTISGDGKHLPAAANFDAFDDVDSRQNVSPASRIFADSMGDSMV